MKNLLRKMDGWTSEMRIITKHKTKKALLDIKSLALKAPIASIVFIVALVFTMAFSSYLIFASDSNELLIDKVSKYTGSNGYISFGLFPQTDVTTSLGDTLSGLPVNPDTGKIEYNGGEYVKEERVNGSGEFRYFKVEPILWRVLDVDKTTNKVILWSDKILESRVWDSQTSNKTLWADCSPTDTSGTVSVPILRLYLNSFKLLSGTNHATNYSDSVSGSGPMGYTDFSYSESQNETAFYDRGFYEKAFSDNEKNFIIPLRYHNVDSLSNDGSYINGAYDRDFVRILGLGDLKNSNYGFSTNSSAEDTNRKSIVTDYGKLKYTYEFSGDYYAYYTYDHNSNFNSKASLINNLGVYYSNGDEKNNAYGIKPEIALDLTDFSNFTGTGTQADPFVLNFNTGSLKFKKYFKTAGVYDTNKNAFVEFGTYPQHKLTTAEIETVTSHLGSISLVPGTVYTDPVTSKKYLYEQGCYSDFNWYEIEPIKWEVLDIYDDKNQIVLMTESCIDSISYDTQDSSSIKWDGSSGQYPALRLFLNSYDTTYSSYAWKQAKGDSKSTLTYNDTKFTEYRERGFLAKAFTDEEREIIVEDSNKVYDSTKDGSNVKDKVRLLSYKETFEDAGVANGFVSIGSSLRPGDVCSGIDTNRIAFTTDYSTYWYNYVGSKNTPTDDYDGYNGRPSQNWWNKSRSNTDGYAVMADGVSTYSMGAFSYNGVRPVITLNIDDLVSLDETRNGSLNSPYKLGVKPYDTTVNASDFTKWNEDASKAYLNFGTFPKTQLTAAEVTSLGLPSSPVNGTIYQGNDGNDYLYEVATNTLYSNNGWFKIEPIKWQVLDIKKGTNNEDELVLLSESILEARIYDTINSVYLYWDGKGTSPTMETIGNRKALPMLRLYLNNYDVSNSSGESVTYTGVANSKNFSARTYEEHPDATYYNKGFLEKAFTSAERNLIMPDVPTDTNWDSYDGDVANYVDANGVKDKVRLLTRGEVNNNSSYGFVDNTSRYGFVTDYTLLNIAYKSDSKRTDLAGVSRYVGQWVNSTQYGTHASMVSYDGTLNANNRNLFFGIRPVITLNIAGLSKESGKGSITDPYILSAGPASYTITAKVNDGEESRGSISSSSLEGTGTLSGTFTDGDEVTITATANEGFAFDGWYKNGTTLVSGNKSYTFSPTSSMNLVAKFIEVQTINGIEYTKWFEKGSGGVSHGYVYLGSYPQRLATAEEIAAVEAIYTSTARTDVPHVVEEGPYAGTYMRANLYNSGAKWYKFEPIKWRILKADKTNNKLILLSDNVLERYRYSVDKNTSYKPNYTVYWYGPYTSNSKAYPWLRNYLNSYDNTSQGGSSNYYYISDRIIQPVLDWNSTYSNYQGFLNTAFTETDRIALLADTNEYKLASKDGTNNQADKVRLLSYEELYDNASNGNIGSSYGFNSTITTTGLDSNRIAFGTDYSLAGDTATGSYVDPRDGKTKTSQKWWTTSWGSMVNQNGAGETGYTTYSLLFGVRPVVTLDLSIANVLEGNEGGDGTFENPYAFDTTPNFNIEIDTNDILFENKGTISSSQLTGDDKDLTGLIRMYSNITINAQASDGYTFDGWYKDNETLLSTNSTYTFEVKDNTSITARFSADETLDDGHTISKYYQLDSNGDSHGYIYYGTYPQRLATADEISALSAKYPSPSTSIPLTLDEGEYAGTYTNENINSTGFKWYKFEPIKWRILKVDKENNRLVLLSDSVIDFNRFWIDVSGYAPAYYKTWWGASTSENIYPWIRIFLNSYTSSGTYTEGSTKKYLTSTRTISTFTNTTSLKNRGFYNVAFSETEKMAILSEINEYKDGTKDGTNTNQKDFVRLLSYEELYDNASNGNIGSSYGFASDMSQTGLDTNRIAFGTDYSSTGTNKPNVEMVDPRDGKTKKAMEWWTLSNGWSIKVDGSGYSNNTYKENEGVRPVITIDLSKAYILDGAKGGEGTFSNPYVLDTTPKYEIDVDTNNGILESKGTISSNELDGDSKHLNKDIRMYEYVTLNAQVNDGYVFDGWYKDGENLLSTNLTYTFEVRDNTNITAKFSEALTLENGNKISKYYQTDSDGVSHGYVTFGSFPQRLATSEEIAAITAKVTSPLSDIPYEIESGPYKGKYQFSSVNNSGNRWYKYEPITWRVLNADVENNKVILLSDSVLESYRFGAYEKTSDTNLAANKVFWWQPGSNSDATHGKEYPWLRIHLNSYDNWMYGTYGGCNWYLSNLTIQSRSIYAGCNEGFYNIAFSDEEQAAIISESNAYKNASIDGSYNQTDKVRMLSIGELYDNADNGNMGSSFGFAADLNATGVETNRVAFATDYSMAGYTSTPNECVDPRDGKTKIPQEYWTISFHSSGGWNNASPYFYTIYSNGAASNLHNENATSGVRPVITVNLDSVTKTKGVGSFASPYALSTGTDEIYIEQLASDGEINYFPDGYIDENGTLHNGEGDVEVVSLNNDSELKAYVYGNGMAIFEGADNKEVEVPLSKKSAITKVAVSYNGFAPASTSGMLSSMTKLESADLKNLDGTNLDDMSNMFDGCKNLEKVEFSQDLDTTKVEDFSEMFKDCSSLETLNLDSFTIKEGATTTDMFSGCTSLEKINVPLSVDTNSEPELPVITGSSWSAFKADDTKLTSVTSLPGKNTNASFSYVKAVAPQLIYTDPNDSSKKYYDSDALYAWDISDDGITGKVMAYYFAEDSSKGYDGELIFWSSDPSNKNMRFDYYGWLDGSDYILSNTSINDSNYVSYLTDNNFRKLTNNKSIKPWDVLICFGRNTNKIKHVYVANEFVFSEPLSSDNSFFEYMIDVTNFDVSKLNVSEIESINRMFNTCTSLESIDLSSWNLANVKQMDQVFGGCTNLETVDFGEDFYLPNVVEMIYTFGGCTNLGGGEVFDISAIGTSDSLRSFQEMFEDCTNLVGVNFGDGFNTSKLEDIDMLFYGCTNLEEANLSFIDTTYVYDYWGLFYNCENLESVDLSGWTLFGERDWESTFNPYAHYNYYYGDIFTGCTSLTSIKVPASVDDLVKENLPLDTDHKWEGYKNNSLVGGTYKTLPDTAGGTIDEIRLASSIITIGTKTYRPSDALYTWDISKDGDGSILAYYFDGNKKKDGVTSTLRTYDGEVVIVSNSQTAEMITFEDACVSESLDAEFKVYSRPESETPFSPISGKTVDDYLTERGFIEIGGYETYTPWSILQQVKGKDIKEINISDKFKVTNGKYLFDGLNKVTSLDLKKIDFTSCSSLNKAFSNMASLTSINLDVTTTSTLKDLDSMFDYDKALVTVTFGDNFNTSGVTTMSRTFGLCSSLTSLNLAMFDFSDVQTMSSMFTDCKKLESITFAETINSEDLTNMSYAFNNCQKLSDVSFISKFDTSSVTDVQAMFFNCANLEEIDLSDNDFSSVTNAKLWFASINDFAEYAKWNYGYDDINNLTPEQEAQLENNRDYYNDAYKLPTGVDESKLEHIYFNPDKTITFNYVSNSDYYSTGFNKTFFGLHNLKDLDLSSFNFVSFNSEGDDFYHDYDLESITLPTKTIDDTVVIELPVVEDSYWTGYKDGNKVGGKYEALPFNLDGLGEIDEVRLESSIIKIGEGSNQKQYKVDDALYAWDISSDNSGGVMAYYFDGNVRKDGTTQTLRKYEGELVIYSYNQNSKMIAFNGYASSNANGEIIIYILDTGYNDIITTSNYEDYLTETGYKFTEGSENFVATPWSILNAASSEHIVKTIQIANDTKLQSGEYLFASLDNLSEINNLSKLDTSSVTNMCVMFYLCSSLTSLDLGGNFNTSSVTNMSWMFGDCTSLTSLDLGNNFDTLSVLDMSSMFYDCPSLNNLDLGDNFDTTNVKYMSYMFGDCTSLTSLDLGENFDTQNVLDMSNMFSNCASLTSLDLGEKFKTQNVIDMSNMFYKCSSLESLDLGDYFDTSSVTSMSSMFEQCSSLTSLDLGENFDTQNVEYVRSMFNECSSLESLDLGEKFNTSKIEDMSSMFFDCKSLEELDLSSFDFTNVTCFENVFTCYSSFDEYCLLACGMTSSEAEQTLYEMYGNNDAYNYFLESYNNSPNNSLTSKLKTIKFSTASPNTIDSSSYTAYANMFFGLSSLEEIDLSIFIFEDGDDVDGFFSGCNSLKKVVLSTKTSDDPVEIVLPEVEDSYWTGYKDGAKVGGTYTTLPFNYQGNGDIDEIRLQSSIITVGEGANKRVYKPSEALYTWDISKEGDPAGSVMAYFFDGKKDKDGNDYSREYKGELVFYSNNDTKSAIEFTDFLYWVDGKGIVDQGGFMAKEYHYDYSDPVSTVIQGRNFIQPYKKITPWSLLSYEPGINPVKEVVIANKLNITSFEKFFAGLNSLEKITGIENINTDNLDSSKSLCMSYTFYGCTNLAGTLDLSTINFTNAKNITYTFCDCTKLEGVDFGENVNTSNLKNISGMFSGCKALKNVDFSKFNCDLQSISSVFSDCESLQSITFNENFKTTNLLAAVCTFENCKSLVKLDLSSFDISTNNLEELLDGCIALKEIKLPNSMTTTKTIQLVAGNKSYWMGYDDSDKPYGKLEKLMAKTSDGKLTVAKLVHDETSPTVTKVESDKTTYGANKDITLEITISEELDSDKLPSMGSDDLYIKLVFGSKETILKYKTHILDINTGDYKLVFSGKTPDIDDEGEFKVTDVILVNNGVEVKDLAGNDLDTSSLNKNTWKDDVAFKNLVVNTTGFPISIVTTDHQGATIHPLGITSDDKIYFEIDFSDYTLSPSKTNDEILECFTLEITNKNSSKDLKNKSLTLKEVKEGSCPFAVVTEDQFTLNKFKVTVDLSDDGSGTHFIEKDDYLGYSIKVSIPKGVLETEDSKNAEVSHEVTVKRLMEEGSITVKLQREGEPDKELIYNKQKQRFEDGNGNEVKFQNGDKIVINSPSGSKITYKEDGDDKETPSNELVITIDTSSPAPVYEEIGSYKDGCSINPSDLKKLTIGFVKLIIIKEGEGGNVNPLGTFDIDADEKEIVVTIDSDYKANIYEGNTLVNTLTETGNYVVKNLKKLLQDLTVKVKFVSTKKPDQAPSGGGGGGGASGPTYTVIPDAEPNSTHKAYMKGYEDKTFRPNEKVSREEVAAIVARLHNEFNEDYNFTGYNDFQDAANRWSKNYIGFCKMKDLIHGYEDGSFHPTSVMTRAELATLVNNFLRVQNANFDDVDLSKPAFSDVDGRWYEEAVNKLAHLGILNGYEDGTFKGDNPVSRIEVAIVMNKVNHRAVTTEIPDEFKIKVTQMFKDVTKDRWFFNDVAEAAVDHSIDLY